MKSRSDEYTHELLRLLLNNYHVWHSNSTFVADLLHPIGKSKIEMNIKGVDALYADKGVDKVC